MTPRAPTQPPPAGHAPQRGAGFGRFILRALLFLGLQALVFLLIGLPGRRDTDPNYLAATLDKQARLRSVAPPRILLVGGSSMAFGVLSESLEAAVGHPVVNMGLVGGLGIEFLLNEVAGSVGTGDIVVLGFEYELYAGGADHSVLRQAVALHPAHIANLSPRFLRAIVLEDGLALAGEWARRRMPWPRAAQDEPDAAPYLRQGFNAWGDLVAHHGLPGRFAAEGESPPPIVPGVVATGLPHRLEGRVAARLERFARECAGRGARACVAFPPYPASLYPGVAGILSGLASDLEGIGELTLLHTPADAVLPDPMFFDTGYHATREGAVQRTAHLAACLRAFHDRSFP